MKKVKRYYSEYIRHCLRFYVSTMNIGKTPRFRTDVDRNNWMACHSVVKNLDDTTRKIVCELYDRGDTLSYKVYNLAAETNTQQDDIWNLIANLERTIAKKRGLL